MTVEKNDGDDSPLPLSQLRRWMSQETAEWIQKGDEKQAELEKELEENAALNASNLFGSNLDSEFEEATRKTRRVQCWSSSSKHIDVIPSRKLLPFTETIIRIIHSTGAGHKYHRNFHIISSIT